MRGPTASSATGCTTDIVCTFCPILDYSEEGCCQHWEVLGRKALQARRGWGTHRAVSPARQDPEVVDLAVQLQPAGNREGEEGREEAPKVLRRGCRGPCPRGALGVHKATCVSPSPLPQQFTAVGKATVTLASPALAEEEWGVRSLRTIDKPKCSKQTRLTQH